MTQQLRVLRSTLPTFRAQGRLSTPLMSVVFSLGFWFLLTLSKLSIHQRFIQTANTGRLPSGGLTRTAAIATPFFQNTYLVDNALPAGLPPVTQGGPDLRNPSTRVYEAFGSNTNRADLMLTDRQINGAKGQLFILNSPITTPRFRGLVQRGTGGDDTATEQFLQELRTVSSTF